jgi:hypothetical protein
VFKSSHDGHAQQVVIGQVPFVHWDIWIILHLIVHFRPLLEPLDSELGSFRHLRPLGGPERTPTVHPPWPLHLRLQLYIRYQGALRKVTKLTAPPT